GGGAERAGEEGGGEGRRETYRQLGYDQQIAQPSTRREPLPNSDALIFERRGEVGFGGLQCGSQPERQAGQDGNQQGVAEDTNVGADVEEGQRLIEPSRREQRVYGPRTQQQSQRAAQSGDQYAFGQQLAY